VVQEFFDPGLGGIGGFGATARLLVDALEGHAGERPLVIMPMDLGLVTRPELRRVDGTDVLLLPALPRLLRHPLRLARLLDELAPAVLISIDHFPRHEYALWAAPRVPLVIHLGDPRGTRDWQRIATVDLEPRSHGRARWRALVDLGAQHRASYRRLRRWSRWLARPLVIATGARCLVARARDKFGEPGLEAHFVPTPLPAPEPGDRAPAPRPTLLVLGRVAAQKRPWIVYALARRLPGVAFVVAGPEQPPGLVEPELARLGAPPNLTRIGLALGPAKEALLDQCWALLNTSVHEGMPVSFLEAFRHARPVVSCVDPDGVVTRFGYPVGEVLGNGMEERDLDAFEQAIRTCLADDEGRRRRGQAARAFVAEVYSPDRFRERFRAMLAAEGLDAGPARH
jgi:glycosyltransferase involved in cell wall biosynthesis